MINSNQEPSGPKPAPGSGLAPFTVYTLLIALRCWWKIATPIALLLAVGAGAIAYYLHKPTYTSDAWLLIKEKPDVILRSLDTESRRFIENHMEIIRSPRLLSKLTQKPA